MKKISDFSYSFFFLSSPFDLEPSVLLLLLLPLVVVVVVVVVRFARFSVVAAFTFFVPLVFPAIPVGDDDDDVVAAGDAAVSAEG